ncbi:hypothetical protein BLOT_009572 [Blomia tropicalis]|nr:hypothetical protein BLOT_009572 [Blomia tropicalis]
MKNKNISKFDKIFQNLVKSIDENLHDFINDVETEKLINKVKNKTGKNLVKTNSFSKIDHPKILDIQTEIMENNTNKDLSIDNSDEVIMDIKTMCEQMKVIDNTLCDEYSQLKSFTNL